MKKILILSDSHHEREVLMRIVEKHQNCEAYIHCGDSQLQSSDESLQPFYVVAGNTDFDRNLAPDLLLDFEAYVFWVTHGHRYGVNWDDSQLIQGAKQLGANIVCFGHTHIPYCQKKEGILLINPGSVISPRGQWKFGTYVLLEFLPQDSQVNVQFYHSRTHELVDEQIVHMS